MDGELFRFVAEVEIPKIDPIRRATRHALRLLEQYGEELTVSLDEESRAADDIFKSDDDNANTLEFTYLSTDMYVLDECRSFTFDQLPETHDNRKVTDVGFVALHLALHDKDGDCLEIDQVVFRNEDHKQGPAIFVGNQTPTPIVRPEYVEFINRGLSVMEEHMRKQRVADPCSLANILPESDLTHMMLEFLEENS